MPHTRKEDQKVDAFSAPKSLLEQAKVRAGELGMTKSGFFRYCLAKEIGYSDEAAHAMAQHKAVTNSVEAARRSHYPGSKPNHYTLNSTAGGEDVTLLTGAEKAQPSRRNAKPKR